MGQGRVQQMGLDVASSQSTQRQRALVSLRFGCRPAPRCHGTPVVRRATQCLRAFSDDGQAGKAWANTAPIQQRPCMYICVPIKEKKMPCASDSRACQPRGQRLPVCVLQGGRSWRCRYSLKTAALPGKHCSVWKIFVCVERGLKRRPCACQPRGGTVGHQQC